ncbi:unnamed protein product [Mucor fragilis]
MKSVYNSSNERSSHSQNSLSSSAKEIISLSSSNSLSDNQQLRETLEQIQESHHEEEEESLEIIQQAPLDLRAPPADANSIKQTHMSPTKEQHKQEASDSPTQHGTVQAAKYYSDDDNEEKREDDDDLPETQPCF